MIAYQPQPKCKKCGKTLSYNEIGIHKKMLGRGAVEYFCYDCLAEYLEVTVDQLKESIKVYKAQGCLLFN